MAREASEVGYFYGRLTPVVWCKQYVRSKYVDDKVVVVRNVFTSYVVYPHPKRETPKTLMGWQHFHWLNRKGIEL